MATLNLGKIKLVHRGDYSGITTYSAGDIVSFGFTAPASVGAFQHSNPVFIYKNGTKKVGSHPYVQTVSGTVASLGIRTDTVTLTVASGSNPGGEHNSYAIPGLSRVYSLYLPGDTKILEKTTISATEVRLKLSNFTENTSVITNDPFIVGARRYGNRYDIQFNNKDWDIYSDTFIFRGDWDQDQTYLPGNIVVRNEQSYICKSPTGIGSTYFSLGTSNNLGPSTTTKAIDPQWDYLDVWDSYVNTDAAQEKDKKIAFFPNNNPIYWKGHPYIPQPRWGQTGVGSAYQGGYPWTIQAGFSTCPHIWMYTANKYVSHPGSRLSYIGQTGKQYTTGGSGNEELNVQGGTGGGSGGGTGGYFAEGDAFAQNTYWTSENNSAGDLPFGKSRSQVTAIQYIVTRSFRAYLFANGTVGVCGNHATSSGVFGNGTTTSLVTNIAAELPRDAFKNRSIVKIDGHSDLGGDGSGTSNMGALDEYGELWVWGDNSQYQCGIGSELNFADRGYYSEGLNDTVDVLIPICLNKDVFFEGKRIIDFTVGTRAMWALDEDGELWSWGGNQTGHLGYNTVDSTKFRGANNSRVPVKLSSQGVLGFTWTGAPLTGVGVAYTGITVNTAGVSYTKTSGGTGWNAEVYSTVGYSSTIAISARAGQTASGLMFGFQRAPGNGASWTGVNAGWYFVDADDYVQYVQNDSNADPTAGGSAGRYQYTPQTVLSLVYEPISNCVHWYYDYHGDGRCVQLVRRLQKNDTNFTGVTSTTAWYFDSTFYRDGTNINSIGISSSVTARTWANYGGIQKFLIRKGSVTSSSVNKNQLYVLDGQGHFWSCGSNGVGQLGDGWTSTNGDNTTPLQRRYFTGIGSALPGRINNMWVAGINEPNVFLSAQGFAPQTNSNFIYGIGANNNYQLTDGTQTDRNSPVIINAPTSQGTVGGISVGIGTSLRNVVHIFNGGGASDGTTTSGTRRELIWAMDLAGHLYASGKDKVGASGAVNIAASDDQNVSNNTTKMQQWGSNPYSWARVYLPSNRIGSLVDLSHCSSYYSYSGASNTLDSQTTELLFEDAQGLMMGVADGLNLTVNCGTSVRAPITMPGNL